MENTICRKSNTRIVNVLFWFFIVPLTLVLSGCGNHATVDRWQARASGNLHTQKRISAKALRSILVDHFGVTMIILTDETYVLPDNGKVSDIQSQQFTYCNAQNSAMYRPKGWDCDDYAAAAVVPMRNYAFGTMFVKTTKGTKHALNVFVNHKHEVMYWEPQTCQYYHEQFYTPPAILIF
ncbi:MAG: hypothetical protein ABFR63_04830 [Thermodesulfobacteriota bacterium]